MWLSDDGFMYILPIKVYEKNSRYTHFNFLSLFLDFSFLVNPEA